MLQDISTTTMSKTTFMNCYILSHAFKLYSFDYHEKHNYHKSILLAVKHQLYLKMINMTEVEFLIQLDYHLPHSNQEVIQSLKLECKCIASWLITVWHFLVRLFTPSYYIFTNSSQPKRLLQHLVAIIGGFIGVLWHILHWNASLTSFVIPSGNGNDLLTSSILVTMHFTSAITPLIL